MKHRVLVAGVGGASLGTEIIKSLQAAKNYEIYACDISDLAYGHFMEGIKESFVPKSSSYVEDIVKFCLDREIHYIIPGGEAPLKLLIKEFNLLENNHIKLIGNCLELIRDFSNKKYTFEKLKQLGIDVPLTREIDFQSKLEELTYPCIIKPYIDTGGSDGVFIAGNPNECKLYRDMLLNSGRKIIAQEYIPLDEGEYTIGVLSLTDGSVVDAIVMKKIFNNKLSISFKNKYGVVSSGYSQGFIGDFPEIKSQAIEIARAVKSAGPLNIQCRLKNGKLYPFEINPRFSASTYLRTLAGFNEIDIFLKHTISGERKFEYKIKSGYYLRSFTESFTTSKKSYHD